MRGFGAVQTCFAAEAQMDKLAAALEHRPGRAAAAERARAAATRCRRARSITGSLPVAEVIKRCAAMPRAASRRSCRATRSGSPAAPATRRAARASGAASASRSASRTSATPRASTTSARRACGCSRDGSAEVHCAAAEVGQGVTNVILQVACTRARHGSRAARAGLDRARRLVGLGVGVADDVDGGRRRARRVPRGARGARARRAAARSTSSASTGTRRRRRSIPRRARSPAARRTSRSRARR